MRKSTKILVGEIVTLFGAVFLVVAFGGLATTVSCSSDDDGEEGAGIEIVETDEALLPENEALIAGVDHSSMRITQKFTSIFLVDNTKRVFDVALAVSSTPNTANAICLVPSENSEHADIAVVDGVLRITINDAEARDAFDSDMGVCVVIPEAWVKELTHIDLHQSVGVCKLDGIVAPKLWLSDGSKYLIENSKINELEVTTYMWDLEQLYLQDSQIGKLSLAGWCRRGAVGGTGAQVGNLIWEPMGASDIDKQDDDDCAALPSLTVERNLRADTLRVESESHAKLKFTTNKITIRR